MEFLLEIVATDAAEIAAAEEGGADRLEICCAIEVGGLTPTPAIIERALAKLPAVAMLRPHARGFVYTDADREIIRRDLRWLAVLPIEAVVFGALTLEGRIDRAMLEEVVAVGKPVVFHRAFDAACDQKEALEDVIASGAQRILTSGGGPLADEAGLKRILSQAAGRVEIIAAGGIRPENVRPLVSRLQIHQVHAAPFRGVEPCGGIVSAYRE